MSQRDAKLLELDGIVFDIGIGAGFGESPAGGGAHNAILEAFGGIGRANPLNVFGFSLRGDAPRQGNLLCVGLVELAAFEVGFVALEDAFDLLGGEKVGLFFGVILWIVWVIGHGAGDQDGEFGLGDDLDGELGGVASGWKIETDGVSAIR